MRGTGPEPRADRARRGGAPATGRRALFVFRERGRVILGLLLAGLSLHCGGEPAGPGGGGLDLGVDWSGYTRRGPADVLHLEIRDREGGELIPPLSRAVEPGDAWDFDLEVPEGDGLEVGMWIDSQNEAGGGIVAQGSARDVAVRAARTTEVEIRLVDTVPSLGTIEARPGDLEYEVRWTRVADALGYELLEISSQGAESFVTADTSITLPLTELRAGAVGAGGGLLYRVRSSLQRGPGLFSDPVPFEIEAVRDLPFVAMVHPENGAEAVRDTTAPRLSFDRVMDWSSLAFASVELVDVETEVPVALLPRGEGADLVLEHPARFRRGRELRLTLSGPLVDLDGRPLDQDPSAAGLQGFSSEFSVEVYDPLAVVLVDPADGAEAVAISVAPELTLSRAARPASVSSSSVRLEDESGAAIPAEVSWIEDGFRVRVAPGAPLSYDAAYTLRATPDVLDLRGEPLDQVPTTEIPEYEPFVSSFHTEVQPVGPRVLTTVPPAGEQNFPVDQTVTVTFDRAIDAATVDRFSTFRVLKLPVGAGILGEITHDAARRVFTFRPTGGLEAGIRYRIDLTTGLRDDAGIPLDQDPDAPGFQGFQAEFRAQDSFAATSVVPADRSERVELTTSVRVTFETALDPATLETGALLLEGATPFDVTRSLSANGRVLTLAPSRPFDTFTVYTVRIDDDLRSTLGDRFDQDPVRPGYQAFESRFTTRPDSIPPRVDPSRLVPPDGAVGVDPEITVQVPFTKRILPASVNGETVILRRIGGPEVPGMLSVSPDSTVAFFDPSQALERNREYELEVLTWIVDIFDVRLDQDPDLPERQAFRSTFRIDHERVPPRVETVSPGNGLEDVSLLTPVVLFFSETMDPSTLPSAFRLLGPSGEPVEGALVTAPDSVRATFTPGAPLREDRVYTVRLEVTATDRWGNPLDQDQGTPELDPFESVFRTARDEVGPRVVGTDPTDGAEEVEPEGEIRIDFDEPIDPASLGSGAITLEVADGGLVALGTLEQSEPGRVRLVPASPLATQTDYLVTVTETVTDTLGNAFDQIPSTPEHDRFELRFRTRVEQDPPFALGTIFEDSPPPPETQPRVAMSEPIDPSSLDEGDVVLRRFRGDELPIEISLPAPDTLLVRPLVLLDALTSYELIVQGITDLVGNEFDQYPETPELDPFVQPFQTARDETPPRVIEVAPSDGSEGARPEVVISLTFSEAMRTSDFDDFTFQVVRLEGSQEFSADGTITWDETETRFDFAPTAALLLGFVYEVRADYRLRDRAGNPLDQDPETPETEVFLSRFLVGDFPEPVLSAAVCSDTTWVTVDASPSADPDGSIVSLWFDWGDGDVSVIEDPGPGDYVQSHGYPCLDFAGCDGVDNDGDGLVDGDDCDESYRIVLRAWDDDGLVAADTSGVSFCAFGVLASEPADGATEVDTLLAEIRIDFSRRVPESGLVPENFSLRGSDVLEIPITVVSWGETERQVVLGLGASLEPSALHTLTVEPGLTDDRGRPVDQIPCTPAPDPFSAQFRTGPVATPSRSALPPHVQAADPAREPASAPGVEPRPSW